MKLIIASFSTSQAAAAVARAAAMQTAKDAKEKAEKEVAELELTRLRQSYQQEQERVTASMDTAKTSQRAKLQERLAQKKASKEAEIKAKEDAIKQELAEKQRKQIETLQQALELETITDDASIKAAIKEQRDIADAQNLDGYAKEIFVLEHVLEKFSIPASKMRLFVEMVMEDRHSHELSDLLSNQYREKSNLLRDNFNTLFDRKADERQKLLDSLLSRGAGEDERLRSLAALDERYAAEQRQLEQKIAANIDADHVDAQLKLRQKQSTEIVSAVRQLLPDDANRELARLDAEQEDMRQQYQKEKEQRIKKIQEEKQRFEEELRKKHDEELAKIEKENEELLRKEKEMQEKRMRERQAELLRQREELEKKARDEDGQINKEEKDQLLKKFQEEQKKAIDSMEAEKASRQKALQDKLKKRREAKSKQMETELSKAEALVDKQIQAMQNLSAPETAPVAPSIAIPEELKAKMQNKAQEVPATPQAAVQAADPNARRQERLALQRRGSMEKIVLDQPVATQEAGGGGGSGGVGVSQQSAKRMELKLEQIERILSALALAQERTEKSVSEMRSGGGAAGAGKQGEYQDPDDVAMASSSDKLEEIPRSDLPPQATSRIVFGEKLMKMTEAPEWVKLCVARSIPRNTMANNAFRNSSFYDPQTKKLYIHQKRLGSSGDFSLVLLHAISHIKVSDLLPLFNT